MKHKILIATLLLLMGISTSATAQGLEYDFYMYSSLDSIYSHSVVNDGQSSNKLDLHMDEWSVFGTTISYGNLTGVLELSPRKDFINALYARYDYSEDAGFGLGIAPSFAYYAYEFTQIGGDGSLISFGTLDDIILPMLFWSGYGVSVAVIYPHAGDGTIILNDPAISYFSSYGFTNNMELPRVELAYNYANDFVNAKVFFGYGAYLYNYSLVTGIEKAMTVHTITAGIGGNATFNSFRIDYTAWYAMNPTLTGAEWYGGASAPAVTLNTVGTEYDLENSNAFGGALAFSYTIGRFTPSVGFGYTNADNSELKRAGYATYLNVNIQLYDWLSITPEISYDNAVVTDIATNVDTTTENIYAGFSLDFWF